MPAECTITRLVQFAETDLAGVMYFANYFRMMEEVEHAFFRSIGTSVCMTDQGRQLGWPRVKVSCEYFAPLRFEDEVELRLKIIDDSKRSLTHQVEFVLVGTLLWGAASRLRRRRSRAVRLRPACWHPCPYRSSFDLVLIGLTPSIDRPVLPGGSIGRIMHTHE